MSSKTSHSGGLQCEKYQIFFIYCKILFERKIMPKGQCRNFARTHIQTILFRNRDIYPLLTGKVCATPVIVPKVGSMGKSLHILE